MREALKHKANTENKRRRAAGAFEINSDNSDEIESSMRIQQQVFRIQKTKIELNNKQNTVANNNLKGTLFKREKQNISHMANRDHNYMPNLIS